MKKNDWKKLNKKELIVPVVLMAGLLVAILVIVQMMDRAERVEIKEAVYQYVFESADHYPDGVAMKKEEEGVLIDYGHQVVLSDGTPLYYNDRNQLILPNSFSYIRRDGECGGKLSYFSTVAAAGNDTYTVEGNEDVSLKGGLLHNGKDVYILLDNAAITWNGKKLEVKPLSTVVCAGGTSILICPYGTGKAIYEELDLTQDTHILMESGIKVGITADIYYKANGAKFLLFSDPGILPSVKNSGTAE